jgi:hypothetical protein
MRYNLIDESRRQNCIDFIKSLDLKNPIEVLINVAKRKRTNNQNSTLWLWYNKIAEHTGYNEEELHEIFKAEFIGYDVFYFNGLPCIKPKSTTKLTVKGMTAFLARVDFIAQWLGVQLPYPDDLRFNN